MADALIGPLLQYGLAGICIIALGFAYIRKDQKLDEINEKRVAEARESIKAIETATSTLETLTEILRDRKSGNA